MRRHSIILVAILAGAMWLPDAAQAQSSPRGLFNSLTRPFRQALRHFGHYPRHRRHHRAPSTAQRMPNPMATATRTPAAPAGSRLGWVGPAAWPTAYEDILGFTFAPSDYAAQLRGRGFDVIANTITGHFEVTRAPTRAATTGAAVRDDADNRPDACKSRSPAQDDWPAARIEQMTQLSADQHRALDRLQDIVAQSVKSIRADCRDSAALGAPDRLNVLVRAIWTVRDASLSAQAPVQDFYQTLTPEQRTRYVVHQPKPGPDPQAKPASIEQNQQYQACAGPNVEAAERMIKQIEQRVRPNPQQAASFENLHKTASDMAKMLMASCAQPLPTEPVARLEAADSQLIALNYAATSMQIAFNDFYAGLDDAQKARLDVPSR